MKSSQIQSKSNREVISESISITARPNPSSYQFILRFNSLGKAPAILRVIDALGRVIETKTQVRPGTDIIVGMDYKPGIYFAVAIQEGKKGGEGYNNQIAGNPRCKYFFKPHS